MNILVLCPGNSARLILLEAILGDLGFSSYSAGSKPDEHVHPVAIGTLKRHNIPTKAPASKSWNLLAEADAQPAAFETTIQILNRCAQAFALLPQDQRTPDAFSQIGQIG